MAQCKPNVPRAVLGKAVTSNAVEPVGSLVPHVLTHAVKSQMLVFLPQLSGLGLDRKRLQTYKKKSMKLSLIIE